MALNWEIKPVADFRKDVCSPCPCHPVFPRGKGHCTEELSIGMGNFVSSLLGKCSWHSSVVFLSHPQAQLSVKLGSQIDGHRCSCRQKWQGEDQSLLCTSFKFVKKKIQSFPLNNHYMNIYFSSSHFAFCLSLVSKHWD